MTSKKSFTDNLVSIYGGELLTRHVTAKILNISVPTLDKKRAKGEGPNFIKNGEKNSAVRYNIYDVIEYIKSTTIQTY